MNIAVSNVETGLLPKLAESRDRAVDWLVSRIADDGEPVGAREVNLYYRLPWALAIAGRLNEASATLGWIERNALTDSGDLRPGAAQLSFNGIGWTRDAASYPLAIIATGAWHLERYDTASAIMDVLEEYQHPESGGGFIERPEHRITGEQDILSTSQLGLAALTTGRRAMADSAFRWMERLWQDQPALPNRLYLCWKDNGLVTDVAANAAFSHIIDFAKPRQAFFNPGIGAAFLGRYHMETAAISARQIGRGLIELSDAGTDLQYDYRDTVHVGKVAWGASAMLDIDPNDLHLRTVVRMAHWLLESQLDDGRWDPSAFLVPDPKDPDSLWKTAEHVLLISVVLAALSAYPRNAARKRS